MKLLPSASQIPTRSVFVARDGEYFTVSGGARVDLSTKGPLRRIFRAVVTAHRTSPRRGLTVNEVFDAADRGRKGADGGEGAAGVALGKGVSGTRPG